LRKNKVKIFKNRAQLYFKDNTFTVVDIADLERLGTCTWRKMGAKGRREKSRYVICTSPENKTILMHRFIMEPAKGLLVDHVNRVIWNNRRSNLRVCSRAENNRNNTARQGKETISGVTYHKLCKKYVVRLTIDGKKQEFGYFSKREDAEARAIEVKKLYYGQYSPQFHKEVKNGRNKRSPEG